MIGYNHGMRFFMIAAVILIIFALIAAISTGGTFLTATWVVWTISSLLAFYLEFLVGPWVASNVVVANRRQPQP